MYICSVFLIYNNSTQKKESDEVTSGAEQGSKQGAKQRAKQGAKQGAVQGTMQGEK